MVGYHNFFDPRDSAGVKREKLLGRPNGTPACSKHGFCISVCPKEVRPMRAIPFINRRLGKAD
ncbi:hypothetical protein KAU45_02760 [bacterium]|nr:hypothetical protein [bacterium]